VQAYGVWARLKNAGSDPMWIQLLLLEEIAKHVADRRKLTDILSAIPVQLRAVFKEEITSVRCLVESTHKSKVCMIM